MSWLPVLLDTSTLGLEFVTSENIFDLLDRSDLAFSTSILTRTLINRLGEVSIVWQSQSEGQEIQKKCWGSDRVVSCLSLSHSPVEVPPCVVLFLHFTSGGMFLPTLFFVL